MAGSPQSRLGKKPPALEISPGGRGSGSFICSRQKAFPMQLAVKSWFRNPTSALAATRSQPTSVLDGRKGDMAACGECGRDQLLALKMLGDEYELQLAGSETGEIAGNLVGQIIRFCKSSQLIANSSSRASVAISNTSVSECDRAIDSLTLGVAGPCRQRRVRIDLTAYSARSLARTRQGAQQEESIHPFIISAGCGRLARACARIVSELVTQATAAGSRQRCAIGSAAFGRLAGIYG
jgi:hypothetical protein